MEEEIKIEDGSGDREFFTIVPNYILNHSTIWDREVYMQMKRIAGESGKCFMGIPKLAKKCGMGKERLKKSIKYLIEHKWIKFLGKMPIMTKGGEQLINTYKIENIWKLNTEFYKGGSPQGYPQDKGGSPQTSKGGRQRGVATGSLIRTNINKNPFNKNQIVGKADGSSKRDLKEFIIWCKKSNQRHIHIIADYADEKKMAFETKGQWQQFLKRNLRPARSLSPYSDEQIGEAMRKLNEAKKEYLTDWTLETLNKFLDK